ncbi:hypothetical protein C5167_024890 [Papaver somniferum]|uniref:Uncharacterized protein n=1 Tax=Papaver somniferum TaxID=3469 RepID=A0A4Y7JTL8_PAPSO|nr:hypothetical protein C5167_024890 [Papaver somniferum]
MSWDTDPQLFLYQYGYVYRITKEFGTNIVAIDLLEGEELSFSKHLSLVNNKENDYYAFKASFPEYGIAKLINSQGLVITWDHNNFTGTWSREELNSPFWSLPGIKTPEIVHAQKENSELEAKISKLEGENKAIKKEKEEADGNPTYM